MNASDERKVGEDTEEDEKDADPTGQYEFGERKTRRMRDPREQTREEREEHEKTHLPFRSWCKHCVRGRGKQLPHYRGTQQTTMSEVHFDYGLLGKEEQATCTIPVLVAKEKQRRR